MGQEMGITAGQGEGSKESGNDVKLIIVWGCYSRKQVRVYSWVDVGLRAVEDLFDIADVAYAGV